MKKVALILPAELPVPAVMGGAVEELVTILIEENEKQHKAEFIIFSVYNKEAAEKAKEYKYSKVIYYPVASTTERIVNRMLRAIKPIYRKLFHKTLIDVAHYRNAYNYLKKVKVDAIVAEGGMYHQFRRFAEKYGKENVYLHIHHHLMCKPEYEGIYGNIIGISEFASSEWMQTTSDKSIKMYTVHNCVKEEKFNKQITIEERLELRKGLGFSENDTVVMYCGRILEVKGVRELLKAILGIPNDNVKLLIIGNADFAVNTQTAYLKEIEELVKTAGNRVVFTGYIKNEELYRYYQSTDMQVIPSLWEEAAGLVAIEGMLSGVPLIVTKSGGLVEYATSDVAIQIERDGIIENIKSAILFLCENDLQKEKMIACAYKQAEKFSKEKFYKKYIEVFDHERNGEK